MSDEQTMIEGLVRAWNTGDGAAWAAHFAEDADFVDVLGRLQRGRAEIARECQNILDTIYRGSVLEMREVASRPLGEDLRLVHTATTLQVPQGPLAGKLASIQTKVVRGDQILAFQNTIVKSMSEYSNGDPELASKAPLNWDRPAD
ncbi:SgcJ/EcaC family oxidoreductase [Nocardia transvalensis]|uniref:SgcJ/EcaC family oxidoreductase n=1 Tax=Nocardia transvalensis TaxID=37333 RepID=UPI001894725F|nr:SgcJ/EcaC family oxidoreductase [Nocardia transvalensis]MBF6331027.1 SgcJ/EcaC family oxidoreductase [Nocardia transvalensis]